MKRATYLYPIDRPTMIISIHALVKRATERHAGGIITDDISIHALVKRATDTPRKFLLLETDFNPRPREEGDLFSGWISSKKIISIHALVKRATSFHCLYYNVPLYFNPRPREEGDSLGISPAVKMSTFQSTPS